MRLVDADATIRKMWALWNRDINNSVKFSAEETQAVTRAFKRLQKAIEEVPTAYDVEKVLEQLDKTECPIIGEHYFEDGISAAIDIVKAGGVE